MEIIEIAKKIYVEIEEMDYNSQCAIVSIVQEVIDVNYQKNLYQVPQESCEHL